MSTIKDKMMIITLNNLVNCSVLSDDAKERIFTNTANAMDGCE